MSDNAQGPSLDVNTLAETENFSIWKVEEPDGETTYHIEFGAVTVHLFEEEWQEAMALFEMVKLP